MSSTPEHTKPGLRERKREQSRSSIERAAMELMTEHGFENATVEMICEAADVSRRTFFNYFTSKEAVVIGHDPGPIPEKAQQAFIHGPRGSILADLARMLLAAIAERPRHIAPDTWRARWDLIRSEPTLAKALSDKIAVKNDHLESLVAERIRLRYRVSGTPPGAAEGSAEVDRLITRQTGFIVAMWWGIARYAIQTAVEHPEVEDTELLESLLDTLTLIQEAEL